MKINFQPFPITKNRTRQLIRKTIPVTIALTSMINAYAGESPGGLVTQLLAYEDVIIFSAGPHNATPPCGAAGNWAFSNSTPRGKVFYAMLLAAQAQGKKVGVGGTGTCVDYGDRETPRAIYIID